MEQLRWELTEMLEPEDDVLFIPLCSGCVQGMRDDARSSRRTVLAVGAGRASDRLKR